MPKDGTITYIKKMLAKGYNPEQIRTSLINAGHSPYEVDVLLRSVAYKRGPSKKLIIIAIILIAVTLIVIGLLLLMQEEETPNIQISLFETELTKGQPLTLQMQIINPAEKTADVTIELMIFSPGGPMLTSKKKIITISDYLTDVPEQLMLDLPPGNYRLLMTARIGAYTLTKEQFFKILAVPITEKPVQITTPIEQRIEIEDECEGGCDDFNICTRDMCIEGKCVHEPIIPCCGNKICEAGEDETCIDCMFKEKPQPKVKPETADLAVKECEQIITIEERDNCLQKIAAEYGLSRICDKISDEVKRDTCYMDFVLNNDFSVCEKISNPYTKNTCFSLSRMSTAIS